MTKPKRRRTAPWVGAWLRGQREASSDDLDAVAARLRRNKSVISRIETGRSAVSADYLPAVLRAYKLTPEAFAAQARALGKAA